MDFPLDAPETAGHTVIVRVAGMLSEPQLLVDGTLLTPVEGRYTLPPYGDEGKPVEIRLTSPLFDRAPIVEINGRRVVIAPPIPVAAYVWCALPLVLLIWFERGVLPALAGLALSYVSLYQIRAASAGRRYVASAVINGVVIAFIVVRLMMIAAHHAAMHAVK